jgi:hypothetical protein
MAVTVTMPAAPGTTAAAPRVAPAGPGCVRTLRRLRRCRWPLHGPVAALCAPMDGATRARRAEDTRGPTGAASDPELEALRRAFPVGQRVIFRTYHPAIWPRDWRRRAEREPWGLRRGDVLQVVGYGAARGFPEALIVRRPRDGAEALVFPPELTGSAAPAAAGPDGSAADPIGHHAGAWDPVVVAADESFPASDPPSWVPVQLGGAAVFPRRSSVPTPE